MMNIDFCIRTRTRTSLAYVIFVLRFCHPSFVHPVSSNQNFPQTITLSGLKVSDALLPGNVTWEKVGDDILQEDQIFANSIAMSGNGKRVLIGRRAGKGVKVFEEVDGKWICIDRKGIHLDSYSASMDFDGRRVTIGSAVQAKVRYPTDSGLAGVFEDVDGHGLWIPSKGNDLMGKAAGYGSDCAVSMSNDGMRVVIGSMWSNMAAGRVRVLQDVKGKWIQVGNDILGEASNKFLGSTVSISNNGRRILLGHNSQPRVYEDMDGKGGWVKMGNIPEAPELVNRSLSMSGDGKRVVRGSVFLGIPLSATVYEDMDGNGNWIEVGNSMGGDAADNHEYYGTHTLSISDDGKRVIFGAADTSYKKGRVQVYEEVNGNWKKIGNDDIDNKKGCIVSMSNDGKRIFVSYPGSVDGSKVFESR